MMHIFFRLPFNKNLRKQRHAMRIILIPFRCKPGSNNKKSNIMYGYIFGFAHRKVNFSNKQKIHNFGRWIL